MMKKNLALKMNLNRFQQAEISFFLSSLRFFFLECLKLCAFKENEEFDFPLSFAVFIISSLIHFNEETVHVQVILLLLVTL